MGSITEEQAIDKRLIHTILLSIILLAAGYAAIFALAGDSNPQSSQNLEARTIGGRLTGQENTPGLRETTAVRSVIAWSNSMYRTGSSLTPLSDLNALAAALEPESLAGLDTTAASMRADAWEEAVREKGYTPAAVLHEILPEAQWFQARLVTKRDEADLHSDARAGGAYGSAYSTILSELPLARTSAPGIEAVLRSAWLSEPGVTELRTEPVSVLAVADRWLPPASTLDSAHQYALDVFFLWVKRSGAVETGPPVRSMTRGIVVAAAGDWKGGDRPSLYRSGGLSPKAGNGVIVFCPDDGRYYAYFHLSSIQVSSGVFIGAGTVLGHGGNTGVNARKKGHGTHVHIEIHDRDGKAWPSRALREFVLKHK
ncbi:MAG: M23 family metallopeptidase [Clostridia bacterium]